MRRNSYKVIFGVIVGLFLGDSGSEARETKIRRAIGDKVEGRYIVAFEERNNPRASEDAHGLASSLGGRVRAVFAEEPAGFSVEMTDDQAQKLLAHPKVRFIEEVTVGRISDGSISASQPTGWPGSQGSLWHLDRIDQRDISGSGLDGTYKYCQDGRNVLAYVLDTGMRETHIEFRNPFYPYTDPYRRVESGWDFVIGAARRGANDPWTECQPYLQDMLATYGSTSPQYIGAPYSIGHGTAVASVLGGVTYGVAKMVMFVPLRVAHCNGTTNSDTAGWALDWILSNANPNKIVRPAVINMSFHTGVISTFNSEDLQKLSFFEEKVKAVVAQGFVVVVSANNQFEDASLRSPARMAMGSTVMNSKGWVISAGGSMLTMIDRGDSIWKKATTSATDLEDGSNFGTSVDIFAPSHQIVAAHVTDDYATRSELGSGTSFASPIVAGMVARKLQALHESVFSYCHIPGPHCTDSELKSAWDAIKTEATVGALGNAMGSPNLLIYGDGREVCHGRPARRY